MRIRADDMKVYKVVTTPEEAYQAILSFEEALKTQNHSHKEEQAFQL